MTDQDHFLGRVTRCSTRGFVGAIRALNPEAPVFGSLCKAEAQMGASQVIGAVYDISISDDSFVRLMASLPEAGAEHITDQSTNRQVPIEISALAIGYADEDQFHYSLPPQPPLSMAPIIPLSDEEVIRFTDDLSFIQLILSAQELAVDDLLTSTLRIATRLRPEGDRATFQRRAGEACARTLGGDIPRLENILQQLEVAAL